MAITRWGPIASSARRASARVACGSRGATDAPSQPSAWKARTHSGLAGPWWQGYHNPEVDRLLDQAQSTPDAPERQALFRSAYRLIRDDAAWLFLYNPILAWAAGPKARGWQPSVDGVSHFA